MTELFREKDFSRIGYFQTILEAEGIQTFVRNRDITGITEIPIPEFYPALCVVNNQDYEIAIEILKVKTTKDEENSSTEVECPECSEASPGNFEICWSCGSDLPS